jgi:hypothetical protein
VLVANNDIKSKTLFLGGSLQNYGIRSQSKYLFLWPEIAPRETSGEAYALLE